MILSQLESLCKQRWFQNIHLLKKEKHKKFYKKKNLWGLKFSLKYFVTYHSIAIINTDNNKLIILNIIIHKIIYRHPEHVSEAD